MNDKPLAHLALALASGVALTGCVGGAPPGTSGSNLALAVQALAFAEVGDIAYHVSVESPLGPVWEADLLASRYGDGTSLSYVGPCDASPEAQPQTIALRVDALYDTQGALISSDAWAKPSTLELTAVCQADTDVPVAFELTLMRRAAQGFFDIAVSFDDIFCSAKLDCEEDDGGPIFLVHGADGERAPSVVLALSCVDPGSTDLRLYLTDVAVDCGAGPIAVDLSGGPGVLYGASDPAPAPLLQAMRFSGLQSYTNSATGEVAGGAYLTAALALDVDAIDQRCTLAAEATAHDGELADFTLPSHATYPVISWELDLTSPGVDGYACTQHALDAPGSGVATGYSAATPPFAVVGYPAAGPTLKVERRDGCTPSCAGRACGEDGCGGSCGVCAGGVCDSGQCSVGCDVALCDAGELASASGACAPLPVGPDITVSGTVVLDTAILEPGRTFPEQVYFRASRIAGATVTLTTPPNGLAVGDEVLVINLMGSPAGVGQVGTHEVGVVAVLDGPRVVLTQPLRKVYATAGNSDLGAEVVRVVRVPVYQSLTLSSGATLTATAFGATTGSGVVAVDVAGTLTFASATSTISARQLGYAGGGGGVAATGPATTSNYGYAGTGLAGPDTARGQAANFGGGGGGRSYNCGNYPGDCGAGGGGGGDYRNGANGYPAGAGGYGGYGGRIYAYDYDARYYLGAGGGGGAADPTGGGESSGSGKNGAAGARGGGLVYVRAGALSGTGAVRADGQDNTTYIRSQPHEEGGGGAGAGGSVVLVGAFATLPTLDVTGGVVTNCDYCGGAGAVGRVLLEEGVQISPPNIGGGLVSGDPGRWSDGAVAASCAGYATPVDSAYCAATDDGVYLVDPDGGAATNAYEVNCDFAAGTETPVCPAGYSGDPCAPVCAQICDNGGACSAPDTCSCTADWTGDTCEEPVCDPACLHGGSCVAPDTCDCAFTGYAGAICEELDVACPTLGECPLDSYLDAEGECVPFAPGPDVTLTADSTITTLVSPGRTTPDQVYYNVTSITDATVELTASATGLEVGDEVLVINLMGTAGDHGRVGVHESGVVADVVGATLTLVRPLTETYAAAGNANLSSQVVRVIRVPHYGNLTLNANVDLATTSFGTGGGSGVIALHVDGILTLASGATISATSRGFSGGAGGSYSGSTSNSATWGMAGTGIGGPDTTRGQAQNYGGGGGGLSFACGSGGDCGGGGGGGGHVTNGAGANGAAGVAYVGSDTERWYLGAGGGGGGADPTSPYSGDYGNGYAGQAGGGIVFIRASSVVSSGTLSVNGHARTVTSTTTGGPAAEEGGGGAGAGGTLVIVGAATFGTATTSGGGSGGSCDACGGYGGAGRRLEPDRVNIDGALVTGDPGLWETGAVAALCAEYLLCSTAGPGVYLIDPNGGDPSDAYETTCD
jgi:hypothetical protein